jgi:hypothetical protein
MKRAVTWVAALASTTGCSGEGPNAVPTEALVTSNGQFIAGPMPGAVPGTTDGGAAVGPLSITQVSVPVLPIVAGAAAESLSGLATSDAVAVGVELAGTGNGYWVTPVGATDPLFPGQISFGFTASFNANDSAGPHLLRFVAIDGVGHAGTQFDAPICIESAVPDNDHACVAGNAPPAAVISLSWDTNFDLDLHVMTPDGVDLSPEHPAAVAADAGTSKLPACTPQVDRDSLRDCVADGLRREDLVFQCPPAPGIYHVYVDPFAACGQPAAHFTVVVYTVAGTCPNCGLLPVASQSGELLASQVTGGASPGLFVLDQTF